MIRETKLQIDNACLSYRHDFGLMSDKDRDQLRSQARAWAKAFGIEDKVGSTCHTATPSTASYKCAHCNEDFTARTADRKRGWALYCSKSCKAKKQEAQTGQYKALLCGGDTTTFPISPSFSTEAFNDS